MPEDSVPGNPLRTRRPRDDDTVKQIIGYLAMSVTAIAAVGVLFLLVRLDSEHTPALEPVREIAPPPIDERFLVEAVAAGVAAAIGSPQPVRGEIVFLEPTPTRAPARPTAAPTTGPMTCPDNPNVLPSGSICLGKAPLPTQTPIPTCLVPPINAVVCMVRPGDVATPAPLLPTPSPEIEGEHTR